MDNSDIVAFPLEWRHFRLFRRKLRRCRGKSDDIRVLIITTWVITHYWENIPAPFRISKCVGYVLHVVVLYVVADLDLCSLIHTTQCVKSCNVLLIYLDRNLVGLVCVCCIEQATCNVDFEDPDRLLGHLEAVMDRCSWIYTVHSYCYKSMAWILDYSHMIIHIWRLSKRRPLNVDATS